ncbi:integrase core domain-containing protein [Achromobacter xylosoxidans]|uniref:integrase core domain-containing protein n=1 Tax=Alcaligenes xylosoxydans xylosoxydans TaxID=85698 RepID=UPI0007620D07|nr:integrase core domain-containing protein [Achromobacter xylosoxidans]KWU22215.1 hypothetical protein AS148_06100 [Achromobacter xylosoxidans]
MESLQQVQGTHVAHAALTLPPAVTTEDRDYPAEIDAGHAGLVRITFRRQNTRRVKHSHWFLSFADTKEKLDACRRYYNEIRSHAALRWQPPAK